ncbi:MAG: pirin family protein [Myxococcaceae bacterium]
MILRTVPLGFPWEALDPFLFCVHHVDHYPRGNAALGPAASLADRNLGMDFEGKDGWRMYHGQKVPGFPEHPHRGFETLTVVRRGFVDHSDSMGATARYGDGDVQWLTAGQGIRHAEMFPLVHEDKENPVELFQIWLNLPRAQKGAAPHFSMLWAPQIPRVTTRDPQGNETRITVVAGELGDARPPQPPPHSWASQPGSAVAVWTIALSPHAKWTMPAAPQGVHRRLYYFRGTSLRIGGDGVKPLHAVDVSPDSALLLENGPDEAELLLLQGRPIGEPVVQHGPFVMNSRSEIVQTFDDYQRTGFGGWEWASAEPVHPRDATRFARRPDGSIERP